MSFRQESVFAKDMSKSPLSKRDTLDEDLEIFSKVYICSTK